MQLNWKDSQNTRSSDNFLKTKYRADEIHNGYRI